MAAVAKVAKTFGRSHSVPKLLASFATGILSLTARLAPLRDSKRCGQANRNLVRLNTLPLVLIQSFNEYELQFVDKLKMDS
jgi:hypothetical protein